MQSRQTAFNLLSGILALMISLAVNFFLSPFIVRHLGEEANGFMQLANNFVTYASLLTLAFNSMASRFITVSYHKKHVAAARQYYSSTILCNLIILAVLIPVALMIVIHLDKVVQIGRAGLRDTQLLFFYIFMNFFANLFLSVYNISMFVKNKLYLQNAITLARCALNAVLLLVTFYRFPPHIFYVSLVSLILTIATFPPTIHIHKKLLPELGFRFSEFRLDTVKAMFSSGIWNSVNQGGNMLMTGLDLLLANWFVGPKMMGVLSIAKLVPTAIINLCGTINTNFAPDLTIWYAKENREELLKRIRYNMKISTVLISTCIITFCAYGIPFYRLWMSTMDAEMLTVLSVLTMMAFIPWAGPQTLYNIFTVTNHLMVNSVAFISTGIMNIAIVLILLKATNWGVYAIAGVSSGLTVIRNLAVTAPYTAKLLHLKWYEFYKDVAASLLCSGINLVVAIGIQTLIRPTGWVTLIFSVGVTYVLTVLLDTLLILNRRERSLLFQKLKLRRKSNESD